MTIFLLQNSIPIVKYRANLHSKPSTKSTTLMRDLYISKKKTYEQWLTPSHISYSLIRVYKSSKICQPEPPTYLQPYQAKFTGSPSITEG